MASLVFSFQGGTKYPNIHSDPEHYEGKTLLPIIHPGNDFKNIKSRYLNMMRRQIYSQIDEGSKAALKATEVFTDDAKFEQLERLIELQMVKNYNAQAVGLSSTVETYQSAVEALKKMPQDKEKALLAISKILSIFYTRKDVLALIDAIRDPNAIIPTNVTDVVGIANFQNMISKVFQENGIDTSNYAQRLTAVLTKPSESLAAYIDLWSGKKANEAIRKQILANSRGTHGSKVTVIIDEDDEIDSFSKAVDISLSTPRVSSKESIKVFGENMEIENVLDLMTDGIKSYGSVKTYRSNDSRLSMVSTSKSNSIVMSFVKKLYGTSEDTNYQVYNALAFQRNDDSVLGKNFKIIRSDLTAELGEKFLVGLNDEQAQRVIISDYVAYPVLPILNAIIAEAQLNDLYGQPRRDLFYISLSKPGNQWSGTPGRKSLYHKSARVTKTYLEINRMRAQGKLSADLMKFMKPENGIPLDWLKP